MRQKLPAIILAAGLSSRMGEFKPLLPLGGVPLIQHVIASLRGSGAIAPIIVVTGHRGAELTAALPEGVHPIENPDYARGEMLSSLKCGLRHCAQMAPNAAGFLLCFADQPAVLSRTISQLAESFERDQPALALPTHQGKRGHPIILSSALIPEIKVLGPNQTLREVVHRHLPQATIVPVEDPAVLEDLDTPDDYARAKARLAAEAR